MAARSTACPVVVTDEGRSLLDALAEGVYDGTLKAINAARSGIPVAMIKVRRSTEPEHPDWQEIVFDVQVDTGAKEALKFWSRIGARIEKMMESSNHIAKNQLEKMVSVHVSWR